MSNPSTYDLIPDALWQEYLGECLKTNTTPDLKDFMVWVDDADIDLEAYE